MRRWRRRMLNINVLQILFDLVRPILFYQEEALITAANGGSDGGTTPNTKDPLKSAGIAFMGTGSLMEGAAAFLDIGGQQQSIRSMYPSQTMDYTNYAMAMQRETRNRILNMIAERSYEGYEGGKNLANIGMAAAQEGTKTATPDYFEQAKQFAKGDEGSVSEVLQSFAPSTTIYKDPSELTEWDKIAEQNGITVTKYNDFQSATELKEALFEKNKSEVEVSGMEIFVAEKIGTYVLNTLFPGRGFDKLCYAGQCDDMLNGIIRGIKAMSRTWKQTQGSGYAMKMNPALEDTSKKEETTKTA